MKKKTKIEQATIETARIGFWDDYPACGLFGMLDFKLEGGGCGMYYRFDTPEEIAAWISGCLKAAHAVRYEDLPGRACRVLLERNGITWRTADVQPIAVGDSNRDVWFSIKDMDSLKRRINQCRKAVEQSSAIVEGDVKMGAKRICDFCKKFDLDPYTFWSILNDWNRRNTRPLQSHELRNVLREVYWSNG